MIGMKKIKHNLRESKISSVLRIRKRQDFRGLFAETCVSHFVSNTDHGTPFSKDLSKLWLVTTALGFGSEVESWFHVAVGC